MCDEISRYEEDPQFGAIGEAAFSEHLTVKQLYDLSYKAMMVMRQPTVAVAMDEYAVTLHAIQSLPEVVR